MSYLTQTHIAADHTLILRLSVCAASEGIPDPQFWVQERMMKLCVTEGWAQAYADSSLDDPGADEAAITDNMITVAIRALWSSEYGEADGAP